MCVTNLGAREQGDYAQWFSGVEKTAKGAGLLWAVAALGDNELYGPRDLRGAIQRASENEKTASGQTEELKPIKVIELDDQGIKRQKALSVYPPISKARLWFGVEREEFGAELNTPLTWSPFIERLSGVADAGLLRLRMQELQLESIETRSLATSAATRGTVFHQVSNMVRDIVNPISAVKESLLLGQEMNDDVVDLINLSDQAAGKLLDFIYKFMNVNKLDSHRPCSLLKVSDQLRDLFEVTLRRNRISFDVEIAKELIIDVPFDVAFISVADIISNARDAIGERGGTICIKAENAGEMINCYISNNGPQIDSAIQPRLFHEIGATTKADGRGWGLYLAYRSLLESRGMLELTSSEPAGTTFTIRFPQIRQEPT
ncbi:MAG TPA: HAMP domain-containing sensor histidine kinase [Blastocatellia bacterium]|nr:HAMP domain-containing sensor histidine kinase [Blastocatellia bacterium]